MTVAELIAKLQTMPQDAEVRIYNDEYGFTEPLNNEGVNVMKTLDIVVLNV